RAPSGPRTRNGAVAGTGEEILAIEDHACVDIPGNTERRVVDDVGVPDAAEECVGPNDTRTRDVTVECLEGVDRAEFGDPGVAELRDVGRRFADERGEQLLMRRRPGHG